MLTFVMSKISEDMKKYKVKTTAYIVIKAGGKRWEQAVPIEYETTAEGNPRYSAYAEMKNAGLCFGDYSVEEI